MEYLFVYNANTDVLSALVDYVHKVVSPSTYKCDLCTLTHDNLGQRKAWKKFKESTKADFSFWYIKQFEKEFEVQFEYPVIFCKTQKGLEIIMSKEELEKLKDVDELIRNLAAVIEA